MSNEKSDIFVWNIAHVAHIICWFSENKSETCHYAPSVWNLKCKQMAELAKMAELAELAELAVGA